MALPSYAVVWAIFVYVWIANYLIRMALSALLPPVMQEFQLSYAQAGLLSSAFFYAYMSMQLPAGVLGDRLGRKRMLISGVLLGVAASVLTGLAGSLTLLFAARLLTGLSQGFLFSNDRVIIAATTPREKMALGQGISFSGAGLGTTLGLVLAGALGAMLPWRAVFFLFALPPLLSVVLLWRFVPEPPHATAPSDPAWPFRRVLRAREFWLLGLTGVMPVYVQFLLATWGPAFFVEVGVRDLARSASLASLQGLAAPFGLLVSGLVADRLHERGLHRKVNIAAAMILTALSLAAHGPHHSSGRGRRGWSPSSSSPRASAYGAAGDRPTPSSARCSRPRCWARPSAPTTPSASRARWRRRWSPAGCATSPAPSWPASTAPPCCHSSAWSA